ncbi:MBL fold metallo-hydrolase [Terrarubrum flagellatum]|uniref:MBL fold metallo-hydrolase n=1 Tax=Terrirubrum flagellatum TaxID=2895980 RepID=UPI0031450DDE
MTIDRRTLLAAGVAAGGLALSEQFSVSPAEAGAPMATAQAPGFYRFKVGDYQVTAIHDGFAGRPLDGFVRNAKLDDVQKAMSTAFMPTDRLPLYFTALVINTGSKLIAIDTGNGNSGAPSSGKWMENLKAAGFAPEQIDTILISHFHGDHINGLRLKDGTAVFPNTEIKVPEVEWTYWMDDAKMNAASDALKGGFQGVRRVFNDMKNVSRYEWGKEVAPGITAIQSEGHTPGHTSFMISSGNGKLLVMSDVVNLPSLFVRHPDWHAVFDMNGDIAAKTRKKMLDMAATEKTQVVFYHAPFPAAGYIEKSGSSYEFVPAVWSSGV